VLRFTADTITIPDEEMLRLMATASVGDDVYKQDRATNDLQARIAKLAGKEAALFVVSGTMSNRAFKIVMLLSCPRL
jgi:threonine aldolase